MMYIYIYSIYVFYCIIIIFIQYLYIYIFEWMNNVLSLFYRILNFYQFFCRFKFDDVFKSVFDLVYQNKDIR